MEVRMDSLNEFWQNFEENEVNEENEEKKCKKHKKYKCTKKLTSSLDATLRSSYSILSFGIDIWIVPDPKEYF